MYFSRCGSCVILHVHAHICPFLLYFYGNIAGQGKSAALHVTPEALLEAVLLCEC